MSEWKPGDAAIVKFSSGDHRAILDEDGTWLVVGRDNSANYTIDRPLVVIDPEDREQVERLRASLEEMSFSPWARGAATCLTTALRELGNPTPPRIDEPGTWGVVEASCVHDDETRREWVKYPSGNWHCTRLLGGGREDIESPDDWDSLVDPVLVREGLS